jgi:hypothetical protein
MKTQIFTFVFSVLLGVSTYSQVLISKTGGSPHPNALLDIKDSSKGLILTKTNNIGNFPLYNASAEDHFDDLLALEGTLLYNKEDKQYYKYDGTVWIPTLQLGGFYNPFETRTKASAAQSWTCVSVLGINTCALSQLFGSNNRQTIPVSNTTSRPQLLVNNLNAQVGTDYIIIPAAGLYHVSGVVGFAGTSLLGLGQDVSYWVNLDVSYDNGATWSTLAFKETSQSGGIFLDLGQSGNKSASVSSTITLPANSRIRLAAAVSTSSLISTYSNSTDHTDTFINVQRLK